MLHSFFRASALWINDVLPISNKRDINSKKDKGACLVHLYEEEGDKFLEKLNGLFSGLLIDKRQKRAVLFNDRYGVERIYYYEVERQLLFRQRS